MNADELLKLIEAGDLHGAMLLVVRAWLEKYHPEAPGVALHVWVSDTLPSVRITIPAVASVGR